MGLINCAVAEHGVEDVAASSGQGDEGLIVVFPFSDLPVVVRAGDRSLRAAKAERNSVRFRTLLPRFEECSPRIEDPDRHVTGARLA